MQRSISTQNRLGRSKDWKQPSQEAQKISVKSASSALSISATSYIFDSIFKMSASADILNTGSG